MTQLTELEHAMLTRLAGQVGPHFRHQTRNEPPLSPEEKFELAAKLLRRNPGEFLARYSNFLCWPDDAECFRSQWNDYTVRFYLEKAGVILSASDSETPVLKRSKMWQRTSELRIKNRRLMAMRRMQAQAAEDPTEGFFSHEQMRERAPELWERMVGRYLSDADRRALLGHQYNSFSGMLLSQLLDTEQLPDRVGGTSGEDDSDDDDSDTSTQQGRSQKHKKAAEQERSRQEFTEIMQSRFLKGLDEDFDYDAVDNDATLDDDMDEMYRDAEESYFDSESPAAAPSSPVEDGS
ncbi:unnamed protein product [Mesocestoides corti]|uniref:DUF2052 domain-containing protein n=1 Tax=Mesocestoides corti TaxID=53468 RepID=A0A0R3UEU5_MESCO|nr:unnamed protein product [Mesocestoides corti]